MVKLPENSGFPAFVAQRIEHLTTDQKVGGSSPSKRTFFYLALSFWVGLDIRDLLEQQRANWKFRVSLLVSSYDPS